MAQNAQMTKRKTPQRRNRGSAGKSRGHYRRGGKESRFSRIRDYLRRVWARLKHILAQIVRYLFSRSMLGFVASAGLTFLIMGIVVLIFYASQLPDISGLASAKEQPGIEIVSQDGDMLSRYGQISGRYIPYHHMPIHLVDAVLATEDRRFFSHIGVDPRGIARAMVANIRAGGFVQGGSTITQQLAKNVFLSPDRTFSRKIQELMMAFWLEYAFTKEEILAIYLNRVYLGGGNYGVDAASRYFFDKGVSALSLREAAMIAGLLKAPSRYSPTANMDLAVERAREVLWNMVEANKLSERAALEAIDRLETQGVTVAQRRFGDQRYFADWIVDQLPQYVGTLKDDVVVTTTLNESWQAEAQDALARYLDEETRKQRQVTQGTLLAMRPDGAVVSMIGGLDYEDSQYNRAIQAKRQPGSAFKLFVYLAAMEQGYHPQMRFIDESITVDDWTPGNYSNSYRGEVTLQEALAYSLNTVAVKISQLVGIDMVRNVAKRLGVKSQMPEMPSLALGAMEMSLKEMVAAYAHLANGGRALKPYGIVEVRRKTDDALLYQRSEREDFSNVTVIHPQNVAKMNAMLADVIEDGTAKSAGIGRPAAGKTGTTSAYRDAWFVGYTPQLVTGVWVGNDDASPTANVTGGSIPAMIWRDFMKEAHASLPMRPLPMAKGQEEGRQRLPWQRENDPVKRLPRQGDEYRLERSFWDTLFDGDNVEYRYPNQ